MSAESNERYDYIVVGSGAGGGTVAARLAENGAKVLVLEAGGDPKRLEGAGPATPDDNRLPADYRVPVLHAFASENDALKWDFFVDHYSEPARRRSDPKYRDDWSRETEPPKDPDVGAPGRPDVAVGRGKEARGILYPRCGALGGCTSHNAMITVYPHNSDWDYIETLTGDRTWSADNMRKYFQRLENCRYRKLNRLLSKLGINPTRHGFKGWLPTELAVPVKALKKDKALVQSVKKQVRETFDDSVEPVKRVFWFLKGRLDPNDWRLVREDSFGTRLPPLATYNHKRRGTRERLLDVQQRCPDNLQIEMNALATRVLFDGTRAVGVEYQKGKRLYRAFRNPSDTPGRTFEVRADKEVILAGGAFNTPQLLMLSGVGPREHLEEHGIPVVVDLPGVGSNLQDRYEVGVVYKMATDWEVLDGATFSAGDPQFRQWDAKWPWAKIWPRAKNWPWARKRKGVYTTNGAVLAVIKRSLQQRPVPDLFIFALLGLFRGYYPSYSALSAKHHDALTWTVLKAHTNNTAGYVRLSSRDPRDPPYVNFSYFDEGNDETGADVESVVEGIKFVREMTDPLKDKGFIKSEQMPGEHVTNDADLAAWVKARAWGHHASCTCPIGPRHRDGVVDGDFQVHGTENLRIVDASVFPKIPGFFIVSSVYTIGEKAADVILAANR